MRALALACLADLHNDSRAMGCATVRPRRSREPLQAGKAAGTIQPVKLRTSRAHVPGGLGLLALLALLCLCASLASARQHGNSDIEGGVSGQFDYYLLTLSWAPSYCLLHPADRAECGARGYGFVLHGLWPQFDSGGYPEACASDALLDEPAAAIGRTLYPSARLMQHEWDAHGTCSGLSAADYFRTVDRALAVVKAPPLLEAPRSRQSLSADQISAAFVAANPDLAPEDLAVACSGSTLSEVRICLRRDLKLRSCGHRVHSNCGTDSVQVPSSR
jgi:ribonuclease T2